MRAIDLLGQRFDRLTVVGDAPRRRVGKQSRSLWQCQCDCGKIAIVEMNNLRSVSNSRTLP